MSVRRALVDCVVLSLQDSAVFYPSCGGCFSRIDVEHLGTARCSKCGHLCRKEEVNYRYRLSLRVSRDQHIFGVTVFGSNLNQFFGIDATGLQRLVQNTDGPVEPSQKFALLLKAIEDCFIGRHFILCMKLTENDSTPWLEDPIPNRSSSTDGARFIATQMILPKATCLRGCAVVTYYEKLLQKALDSHFTYVDVSRPYRTTQLLLTPHHSPTSSFDTTLSSPQFVFPYTHRSRHIDSVLSPTPPWQQSLEIVTSSAEQEESDSLQACGDKKSSPTNSSAISHWVGRGCQQKHAPIEKNTVFHLEDSLCSPSYGQYPNSPSKTSIRTSSSLSTSFILSQPHPTRRNDKVTEFSSKERTSTLLSSSVDWEDLPLSESLTEFICGGNKDLNNVVHRESNTIVLHQKNSAGNLMELKNLTTETTFAGQKNKQLAESHSQVLLDISNVENGHDRLEFSDQACKNFLQQENLSHSRSALFPRFDNQNEFKPHFENEEQNFIEDAYNCSADLFGNSSLIYMNTEMLSCKAGIVGTTTEVCPLSLKPDSKPLKQSPSKNYKRDSLTLQDFIPSSQSTPNIKSCVSHLFKSACRKLTPEFSSETDRRCSEGYFENMCELNSKKTASATFLHPQRNSVISAGQPSQCGNVYANERLIMSTTPSRCSYKRTTGRWPRKPDENEDPLPSRRHFYTQRRSRSLRLGGAMPHRRASGVLTESVSDSDNSDMLIPPTPVRKTLQSVPQQETQQPGSFSSPFDSSIVQQQQVTDDCQITVISAHREEGSTKCVADDGNLDLLNDYLPADESWSSDWSRDLFSDSV